MELAEVDWAGLEDELLKRELAVREAHEYPANFLDHVRCLDTETQDEFEFQLLNPEDPWYWQRELLDLWWDNSTYVVLKARQLGITWLAGGYALWQALMRPGSRVLIFSINEKEAIKVVRRIWDMYRSLPPWLTNDAKVLKPARGHLPSTEIEFEFPNERRSTILAFASSKAAGHGETAALVILDEFSRQEYASETWKAVLPTASKGGKILVISTGNGISTMQGDEAVGNFYHHLWKHGESYGIGKRFLRWDLHPDRDEEWYQREAMKLPSSARGEQYPRNEIEAFILSGGQFFDPEDLLWYQDNTREPVERFMFDVTVPAKAKRVPHSQGWISVYEHPQEGHEYVIGADTAGGKGLDFSAAVVVDLATMAPVAEFHAKLGVEPYAEQLHYLGRWYNTALLAPEYAGGWGDAVIAYLRDGSKGRPSYPKLYRHRQANRPDDPERTTYGFPMNTSTRPEVVSALERVVRERSLPYISTETLFELGTFVHRKTGTSPAAQDGSNDDRVMALGIALEIYRKRGFYEHRYQTKAPPRRRLQPLRSTRS